MAASRILVLSPLAAPLVEALFNSRFGEGEARPEVEVETNDGSSREALLEAAGRADVIIGDYTYAVGLDAEVLAAAVPCLLVQQPSVGYQHIDVEAAAGVGIPVANAAGANSTAVAEHTIMCVLALLKKLMVQHGKTKAGEWAQDEMSGYGVFELDGKTLGIIGMGRIGREVALRARPFGCGIIYYDINPLSPATEEELTASFRDLDALLGEADVVTLHAPHAPETENMLNAGRIAMMKPGAVLVNVARGALVDERALAVALREGRLAGAAVDVFSREPVEPENPLLTAPGTILTPHTAGATNESRLRIIGVALDNVARVLSGGAPLNVVNGVGPAVDV